MNILYLPFIMKVKIWFNYFLIFQWQILGENINVLMVTITDSNYVYYKHVYLTLKHKTGSGWGTFIVIVSTDKNGIFQVAQ